MHLYSYLRQRELNHSCLPASLEMYKSTVEASVSLIASKDLFKAISTLSPPTGLSRASIMSLALLEHMFSSFASAAVFSDFGKAICFQAGFFQRHLDSAWCRVTELVTSQRNPRNPFMLPSLGQNAKWHLEQPTQCHLMHDCHGQFPVKSSLVVFSR